MGVGSRLFRKEMQPSVNRMLFLSMQYSFIHDSVCAVMTGYWFVHLCTASIALVAAHDQCCEKDLNSEENSNTMHSGCVERNSIWLAWLTYCVVLVFVSL